MLVHYHMPKEQHAYMLGPKLIRDVFGDIYYHSIEQIVAIYI